MVQKKGKIYKNTNAFGIFGYSFLAENRDKIKASKVNGKLPTPSTIANGNYPVSRSLFSYVKKSHISKVKAIELISMASNLTEGINLLP